VLLDMLPTRYQEIIISNMRKTSSLTLSILKSLYPQADLDAVGEGFATTCTEKRLTHVIEMLLINML
jgi:hypothetical protein